MDLFNYLNINVSNFKDIMLSIAFIIFAIFAGFILNAIIQYLISKWRLKLQLIIKGMTLDVSLLRGPLRMLIPAICVILVIPFLKFPEATTNWIRHFVIIWIICAVAWFFIRLMAIIKILIMSHYEVNVDDNLKARQVNTQISVIQRVLTAVIIILAIAMILMTFEKVRQIGVSILASAGVAGIILGLAAQRSISTLIAGIQIAITQPIRIDDVIIIENEWGRIEEITLTYVVLRIWDQRRLVIPINFFIEKAFQNWTRTSAELLGTVYIYVDYRFPVDVLRKELNAIVEKTPLWDSRVAIIQVTNTSERTIEVRALVSARNSSDTWELRCLVREKLIMFLQNRFPEFLPKVRLEMESAASMETENANNT